MEDAFGYVKTLQITIKYSRIIQEYIVKNSFELLGSAKALLPIWSRKVETSGEMSYAEIKAYIIIGAKTY